MKRLAAVLLAVMLAGCATVRETAESPDTFAACKGLDVATTVVGVSTGALTEGNPLVAKLLSHGFMPFILLSAAMWYVIDRVDSKPLTMGANAVTCPVAARNVWMLLR